MEEIGLLLNKVFWALVGLIPFVIQPLTNFFAKWSKKTTPERFCAEQTKRYGDDVKDIKFVMDDYLDSS